MNLRTGQRWTIGAEVVIQITKRRGPCKSLNVYPGIQAAIFDALGRVIEEHGLDALGFITA